MAILDGTKYTLADIARHMDPNGKIAKVAEVLTQPNELIGDIPWLEGNLPTGHQTTIRSSLPTGSFRQPNYGVAREKETTKQQMDAFASLESYSEIDEITMNLNGNSAEFRWQKDQAFIEGLGQTFARYAFYGNSGQTVTHSGLGSTTYTWDGTGMNGLAVRYPSTSDAITGSQCIAAYEGADADQFSIWLIGWGPGKVYGVYPKGSKAGLDIEDLGKQTIVDYTGTSANGASVLHEAYRTHFKWACGLTVEDYRYVVHIYNCDRSAKASWTMTDKMVEAIDKLPSLTNCNPVFYMCGTAKTLLRIEASSKTNIWYKPSELGGPPVLMFQEVPIHRCDLLAIDEAHV